MLRRLLSKTAKTPEDHRLEAERILQEIEQDAIKHPKRAAKTLGKHFGHGPLESVVDFDAPLHDTFVHFVLEVFNMLEPSADPPVTIDKLPAVKAFTDPPASAWDDIRHAAQAAPEGVTYIRYTKDFSGDLLTLVAVETLALFVTRPELQAAFPGETYMLLRNPLVGQATADLKADLKPEKIAHKIGDALDQDVGLGDPESFTTPCRFEVFGYFR